MFFKIVAGIVAAGLLVAFIGPVIVKLKEIPLIIVAAIGIGMMLIDLLQSMRSKED